MKTTEHDPSGGGLIGKTNDFLIIGSGGLLTTIKKALTRAGNMRWQVPAADNIQAQADYLVRHPVPPGSRESSSLTGLETGFR